MGFPSFNFANSEGLILSASTSNTPVNDLLKVIIISLNIPGKKFNISLKTNLWSI